MAGVMWRYYRLYVTASSGGTYVGVATMRLSATSGGAQLLTGGTASASSEYSGAYTAALAFNSSTSNSDMWYSSAAAGAPPHWLKYDLGAVITTAPRYLFLRVYSGAAVDHPSAFNLQGSDDNSTWTDIISVSSVSYELLARWNKGVTREIEIPIGWEVKGNSTHSDTTPTDRVMLFNWSTGRWVDTATPDGSGDYASYVVGPSDVAVVHIGDTGYAPQTDGPVTPDLR